MSHSPLDQFLVKVIVPIKIGPVDLSFTNSSLFMMFATLLIITFLFYTTRRLSMVPGRGQMAAELCYRMTNSIMMGNVGPEAKGFFPLIFSLFMFVLTANLLGMLPYSFTTTSQLVVTFMLGLVLFCAITITGIVKNGWKFLDLFLPEDTPIFLAPIMILIELFTFLSRPLILALRLAANMTAGHVLIKVFASFIVTMGVLWKWIPILSVVMFTAFEMGVAILQAYIFAMLSCVYLNDVFRSH
jgi:F-type H+-transporting ATPase subunit a